MCDFMTCVGGSSNQIFIVKENILWAIERLHTAFVKQSFICYVEFVKLVKC